MMKEVQEWTEKGKKTSKLSEKSSPRKLRENGQETKISTNGRGLAFKWEEPKTTQNTEIEYPPKSLVPPIRGPIGQRRGRGVHNAEEGYQGVDNNDVEELDGQAIHYSMERP